jgi:flagellin-like protein
MTRYRRAEEAVSPVIGTILMVAVTVILAAVLYVVVGPLINPVEEPPVNLILMDQGTINQADPTHWDTFFTISAVEAQKTFEWSDVSMVITGSHGSLLTDATISYGDADADGFLDVSDSILVNGMTDEYTGATLKVLHRGSMIGQTPIHFVAS